MQPSHLPTVLVATLALGVSGACATKGYVAKTVESRVEKVEGRVGQVEERVGTVDQRLNGTTAHLNEVDQTATNALESASAAGAVANGADAAASKALTKAERLEAENRRLLFEVVMTEAEGQFKVNDATLPTPAAESLDALVDRIRTYPEGVFLEIEGHTDATGPSEFNQRLGLERAEKVKRYLYEQRQLPLHKMSVISYGETKPIAPNKTRAGRAENRRVVVRVLGAGTQTASASTPD